MNYFDKKFDEIAKFLKSNQQYIDSNPDYRQKVRQRIENVLLIASVVSDEEGIGVTVKKLTQLNLDGLIKMFSGTLEKEFFIDLNNKLPDQSVPAIGEKMMLTIKQFKDDLDAEIVDIS